MSVVERLHKNVRQMHPHTLASVAAAASAATVIGWVSYTAHRVIRRVETVACTRYRDGYAEGYVDGLNERHPRPDRTLRPVR